MRRAMSYLEVFVMWPELLHELLLQFPATHKSVRKHTAMLACRRYLIQAAKDKLGISRHVRMPRR